MSLRCGIVGLPNVGKSTLFNALMGAMQAEMANYPFCTIEPNVGIVPIKDERLNKLSEISNSKKIIPTTLTFVDIAGLVKGASQGEGMGNKFLSHIYEVDAIIHVLRCFKDENIQHVQESIDSIRDKNIIETELLLADLQILEKAITNLKRKSPKDSKIPHLEKAIQNINDGQKIENIEELKDYQLLSNKPVLYVCNVEECNIVSGNELSDLIMKNVNFSIEIISATIEYEIANISDLNDKTEFLQSLGLNYSGLEKIAKRMYKLLDLITYFTTGKVETRAWPIKNNTSAPKAAGKIHSDFEKKFIRAETISYQDYIDNKGINGARERGLIRFEGKDYIVQDGDVMTFHHN